jgi:hypothetical protein
MKALHYDEYRNERKGDPMERVVTSVLWLLIAFMLGITIGLYCGAVTAKHQFQETMILKDHFVAGRLSD